jgi:predicted alpha-1,2-mannosidase
MSFQRLIIIFILLLSVYTSVAQQKKLREVDYVNTYIGTAQDGAGGIAPAVGPPFAMTNFSAQTTENCISRMPYLYEDSTMLGFIATHQPTIWMGDYGYVAIMPGVGPLKVLPNERKLSFKHKDEFVSPYYYTVQLKTNDGKTIKAETAATERCGIYRFTFPSAIDAHFVIQALNIPEITDPWVHNTNSIDKRLATIKAYVHYDAARNEITGYNPDRASLDIGPALKKFKGYFIIQFDKKIQSFGTWTNDSIHPLSPEQFANKRMGAYVSFSTKKNEVVQVKIATSFISIEQARENLQKEIPEWNLTKVAEQTKETWQHSLERFKVDGVSPEQKTIFYTALYHTLLFPRIFSEYGRYYSAFDDTIHNGVSYNDYSLWDTYRAEHPLLIFSQPERVNDMITSMLQMYKEGGWLPMWPNPAETNIMIGTHADAVIADAYVKGFRGFDIKTAYAAMHKDAMIPTECDVPSNKFADRQVWSCFEGRAGSPFYHSLGYIPSDVKSESVSRTIEYGVDDYTIAQVAKSLGKTDDYNKLMQWSVNYKNLYNVETGFISPRLSNGEWDPKTDEGFTEGSPWTYLFGSVNDISGLIDIMGGQERFAKKLDENFNGDFYRHDNEPGHHYIYLYDYCGQPWKTQELARKHTTVNYRNKPNGINGNDDCGQMSAWYIFSIMGFYPVTPASGIYAIGAPQFSKLSINYMVDGKPHQFTIVAKNLSEQNKYVQSVRLDNSPLDKPFISHQQIINSNQLTFEMTDKPTSWGK